MRASRGNGGITIIEMMVVVAIVAILLAIGVPNLYEFVVRNRIEAAGNEFVAALNLARSEAIRRGQTVVIKNNSGTLDWSSGWTLFADSDRDGAIDAGEERIREGGVLNSPPMTLFASRIVSAAVVFTPDGLVNWGNEDVYIFLFCYDSQISAGSNRPRSWAVMVNRLGRVRLSKPDIYSGVLMLDGIAAQMQALPANCKSVPSGKL